MADASVSFGILSRHRMGRATATAWAAVAVVLLHLCLSLLLPQQAWITCTSWIVLYALALATALREARVSSSDARWRWRMVAINFSLAICSFLCILYAEYWVHFSPTAAWLNDLLRAYRSLPLLLAVCTPEESEHRLNRSLDVLQLFLIAAVLFALFLPGFPGGHMAPPDPELVNRYNYTLAVILALLALLAVFTARRSDARLFHRVLAMYLWIGVPVNLWTNHVLINTLDVPSASALFVPSDLCLLAFIVAAPFARKAIAPRAPSRRLLFLRLSAPAFLPLTAMLAGMLLAVAGHHPVAGIAFGVTGLALFGFRSAHGQYQMLSAQWNLESANERLEALSQRDPLTGLYNRRWFSEAYVHAWSRAQLSLQPLSILLLDVDHFKLFNDTQGHAAGDHCLQTIAATLGLHLYRPGDALVRFGGEEFLVMLQNTDAEGAERVARNLLEAIAQLHLPHSASPLGFVTFSIGRATWTGSQLDMTSEGLLLEADCALYSAKKDGRNCVRPAQDALA
jgi:diguanylate cyclase (GGDEF)-like protein